MSTASEYLRKHIQDFMGALPIPEKAGASDDTGFNKHWTLRGNDEEGVYASYVDRDDVIEFGLLSRSGDAASNLLHATIVLDRAADVAELNCMSEADSELNFDAYVHPEQLSHLDLTLETFAQWLHDSSD